MKKPKLSGKRYSPVPDIYTPIDITSMPHRIKQIDSVSRRRMRWSSNCVRSVDAQFREAATKRRVSNTVVSLAPSVGSASVGAATLWHRTGKDTGLEIHGASERQPWSADRAIQ